MTNRDVGSMVERMETQHGMISNMANRGHATATAADLVGLEYHEVVAGEVVEKASPTLRHVVAQGYITGALHGFMGHGRGEGHPGGWWLGPEPTIELEPGEVYQPDIGGWRIERLPVLTEEWPIRTTPDWVCEVLSPTTSKRDIGHKQRAYHRARVGHYWVADPLHRAITVYRWREDGYVLALAAGAGDVVRAEPFGEAELDVAAIFGVSREQG